MSDTIYIQNLKVDGSGSVEDGKHYYNASFTSTSLNSYNYRFAPEVMASIVKQANDGVEVREEHQMSPRAIGKFTNAYLLDELGRGNFFIREGLQGPQSDDVIKLLDSGIMDCMSIGFAHTDQTKVINDLTGNEMKPKFSALSFSFYFQDPETGHILGRKTEVDGEEKTVTATYKGDVKLREISVVGKGADPTAKVIRKLQEALHTNEIEIEELPFISESLNIELSAFNQMLGINTKDTKHTKINSTKKESPMANEALQAVIDELKTTVETLKEEKEELEGKLETELEDRPTVEEFKEVSEALETKTAELAVKEQEITELKEEYETLASDGKKAREVEKKKAHAYLQEYYGDDYRTLPECTTHINNVDDDSKDIETLQSLTEGFRAMAISKRPSGKRSKVQDLFVPKDVKKSQGFAFKKEANPSVVL